MTLARLVRQQNWNALDDAWTEHVSGSADIEPALDALQVGSRRRELSRLLSYVRDHARALEENGRSKEACRLLGEAMILGGSPGELAPQLMISAKAAYAEDPRWETFLAVSDLRDNHPDMRTVWGSFQKLLSLEPERVIYHAKGWGLGKILEVDVPNNEVTIRFVSGKRDRFPLKTSIEIFEILEKTDLRALVVEDPEELASRLKSEPLDVLRWIAKRNDGRVNHAGIKLALGTLGVEGPKFTAWWRKARKVAETSEWFELSGPANRVTVRLLDQAEDPAEGLRRQLRKASGLAEALARVKALMSENLDEGVRDVALETLETTAAENDQPLPARMATWLFLREVRGETPSALTEVINEMASEEAPTDPSQAPALWALLQQIPGMREQERALELVREQFGEGWLDECAKYLAHSPPGMVKAIIDALSAAERDEELVQHYLALLARPTRTPTVLVRLAERVEKKGLGQDLLPPPIQRVQCLLQLGLFLQKNAPGNIMYGRARQRLTTLLTSGEPPLLRFLLADADEATLRGFASMVEGGLDGVLERLFTRVAVEISPLIFRGEERPFWEGSSIWTTRAGLKQHEEELRILRDIKIPENAEAIGRAASYGDLSENSEWESAIEEQRNLTAKAMELEAQVRDAQLLEEAAVPAETVAPGTQVSYHEEVSGEDKEVSILGPWEADGEAVISYRSPIAVGMLGKKVGDTTTLTLPTGPIDVVVKKIVPFDFD